MPEAIKFIRDLKPGEKFMYLKQPFKLIEHISTIMDDAICVRIQDLSTDIIEVRVFDKNRDVPVFDTKPTKRAGTLVPGDVILNAGEKYTVIRTEKVDDGALITMESGYGERLHANFHPDFEVIVGSGSATEILTLEQYDRAAAKTVIYKGDAFAYVLSGLMDELGEAAAIHKRSIRDGNGTLSEEDKEHLEEELGDLLWYLTRGLAEIGSSLKVAAQRNVWKLEGRDKRGTLHGKGDR